MNISEKVIQEMRNYPQVIQELTLSYVPIDELLCHTPHQPPTRSILPWSHPSPELRALRGNQWASFRHIAHTIRVLDLSGVPINIKFQEIIEQCCHLETLILKNSSLTDC